MKKIIIVMLIMSSFLFIGCSNDKDLKEISYDDLRNKIESKESFVLYVGSSSCSHCAEFRPKLEKVINKYKLDVYYVNMANLSEAKYNSVMKKVDGKGTPITVYIEKGKTKISPKIDGAGDEDMIINFFKDLKLIKGE